MSRKLTALSMFAIASASMLGCTEKLYPESYCPYLEPKENKKKELSASDLESIEKAKQKRLRKQKNAN